MVIGESFRTDIEIWVSPWMERPPELTAPANGAATIGANSPVLATSDRFGSRVPGAGVGAAWTCQVNSAVRVLLPSDVSLIWLVGSAVSLTVCVPGARLNSSSSSVYPLTDKK